MRNVLILCTGNTARSVLAEGILRQDGQGRYRAYSAGSQPKGQVNPLALATLARHGYATEGLSSKSWDVFAAADAPVMDIVVTVCDSAAAEVCPIWPGAPTHAHWGIVDPAGDRGSRAEQAGRFEQAFQLLKTRISRFLALADDLPAPQLAAALAEIGRLPGATSGRA
jgi:arsenate reductase